MLTDPEIISQQIDENGKTRILNFKTDGVKISLFIPPSPPLNVKISEKIYRVSEEVGRLFLKKKKIVYLKLTDKRDYIRGIYNKIFSILVPIDNEREEESKLKSMRKNQKIAEFLKQYALFTYSIFIEKDRNYKDNIEDIFIVKRDHEYNIEELDKRLFIEDNNVIYDGKTKRMIVTSKEMRNRLTVYIKTNLKTNQRMMVDMKNRKTIDTYYQGIVDFRRNEEEIVFTSRLGLLKWKISLQYDDNYSNIFPRIIPFVKEPYYFRNFKIKNNKIMIVQNVEDNDKNRAIMVSHLWNRERINYGYSLPLKDQAIPYTVFNSEGFKSEHNKNISLEEAFIYEHTEENYSALLFI
jgi:hypothetical protein